MLLPVSIAQVFVRVYLGAGIFVRRKKNLSTNGTRMNVIHPKDFPICNNSNMVYCIRSNVPGETHHDRVCV